MSEAMLNFFKADPRALQFTLYEHMRIQQLFEDDRFNDFFKHMGREECDVVIDQCLRFCNEMSAPPNRGGDAVGCKQTDRVRAERG